MFLRCRRNRGCRRTQGNGLLPLPILPIVVRRAGKRFFPMVAGGGGGGKGKRAHRRVLKNGPEPPSILSPLRRTSDDSTPATEDDRCLRSNHPCPCFRATGSCQLR